MKNHRFRYNTALSKAAARSNWLEFRRPNQKIAPLLSLKPSPLTASTSH